MIHIYAVISYPENGDLSQGTVVDESCFLNFFAECEKDPLAAL